MPNSKYREYFDIDEGYFPCIDEAAIKAGASWESTYPHETFIKLLTETERALARQNNGKTLWVEGAYGTGKSQCIFALKRLLEVSEDEVRKYWDRYDPLKQKKDLCEKIIGHKKKGVVVAYRYASGDITSTRELCFAIQESVKKALSEQKADYLGENSLTESIIAWLKDDDHKAMFDSLLINPNKKWREIFSEKNADEIIAALRKGGEIETKIKSILKLAAEEGITALDINSDRLIAWLTDVIDRNNIKIVFIWDEFSEYFSRNSTSLTEFQKIVSLAQNKPFYLIVVTHNSLSTYMDEDKNKTHNKIRDRFVSIDISLPDNIAIKLVRHAFSVKPAAERQWNILADDLNNRVKDSRSKVMEAMKIDDPKDIKAIMPLHPMAALVLKYIATAFRSNQRSMFEFIKSAKADDVRAFQWFIENTGPHDAHPLLTVDMLWNFFYEKGKDNLTSEIRQILDTFPQQQDLRDDEKRVLKAILIMQAVELHIGGGVDILSPTGQNLSYVFEGISDLEGATKADNIARGLIEKGILISIPKNKRDVYGAAVLAGDLRNKDKYEEEIIKNCKTARLVEEGGLSNVLQLSSALQLRFESEQGPGKITTVTVDDFTRKINYLRNETSASYKFQAVLAFAKDENEALKFRGQIKTAAAEEQYKDIIFIDALSTPLGQENFRQYANFSAIAQCYQSNNNKYAKEYSDKAKHVLDQDWHDRIYNGDFVVYTYNNQEGEKCNGAQGVLSILRNIVLKKFPYVFDFVKKINENQLKNTQAKLSALCGILQTIKKGAVIVEAEKAIFPNPTVWHVDKYWENAATSSLPISKIKIEIDKKIEAAFKSEGKIELGEVYDILETTYGFAPCNLSAFIAGFLLKEYSSDSYRYADSMGHYEQMSPEKLAEMLGNHIGKKSRPTYIMKMTLEEMAFYTLTEEAWGIAPNSCSFASMAATAVSKKMHELKLPVWCLEYVGETDVFSVVQKYTELVQKEGSAAHDKALEIGKIASVDKSLADKLRRLLTRENCQKGMTEYLKTFDGGKILELASDIGATGNVLSDISRLFEIPEHSCLWDKKTGEDVIRNLQTEYSVVKKSNAVLSIAAHSLDDAYRAWRDRLNFINISYEILMSYNPELTKFFDKMLRIYKCENILTEQLNELNSELMTHKEKIREILNNDTQLFAEVYKAYLEDLNADDIAKIKSGIDRRLFKEPKTKSNAEVKNAAEEFRKQQIKQRLLKLWSDKTGTKNPREWSNKYKTPILCIVPDEEYEKAKRTFDTLNRAGGSDSEIEAAFSFLEDTKIFGALSDKEKYDEAFKRDIIGAYCALLPDINKVRDALERLSIDVYEWRENPAVKKTIKQLADAEYNAGGSDRVISKIDDMDEALLKRYLKRLVKDSMTVGIEILANEVQK